MASNLSTPRQKAQILAVGADQTQIAAMNVEDASSSRLERSKHLFDIAALRKNSCQYGLFLFGLVLGRPISMEEDFRRFFVPHHRVFRTFDAKASLLGWNPTLSIFLQTFGRLGVPVDFVRLAPRPAAD